ncbi:antitoxin VapB family protein [Candidatus Micrarchaeota archaeon]|nr:antitoxin VapB family protein [Candidatus Micrarchaeota archaeon]
MTKMISVRDEVYAKLAKLKNKDESFSDLFLRLSEPEKKKSIMDLAGVWENRPEMDAIFDEILKRRSNRNKVKF